MKAGDRFEVIAPSVNWNIHDNLVTGCLQPVVLDVFGSETTLLRGNLVERGEAAGVKAAIEVRGRCNLIGNHVADFDEKDTAALALWPDRFGKPCPNVYRTNVIERCTSAVAETAPGLWAASSTADNEFIQCGGVPAAKK